MSGIHITLEQLRGLIGLRVKSAGTVYHIIEVLEDGPSIVLMAQDSDRVIQGNIHGDATRRVPETLTVPVLTSDRQELHPAFLALDLVDSG